MIDISQHGIPSPAIKTLPLTHFFPHPHHGRNRVEQGRKRLQKEAALWKFTIHPTDRRMSCVFRQIHQVPRQSYYHPPMRLTQILPLLRDTPRLNHLKRHLLTRKSPHSPAHIRSESIVSDQTLIPESMSAKYANIIDTEPSHQHNDLTRDATSNLPGEISSQNTCEYAANSALNYHPTSDRRSPETEELDYQNPGENPVHLALWLNASATCNSLARVVWPRRKHVPTPTPSPSPRSK